MVNIDYLAYFVTSVSVMSSVDEICRVQFRKCVLMKKKTFVDRLE